MRKKLLIPLVSLFALSGLLINCQKSPNRNSGEVEFSDSAARDGRGQDGKPLSENSKSVCANNILEFKNNWQNQTSYVFNKINLNRSDLKKLNDDSEYIEKSKDVLNICDKLIELIKAESQKNCDFVQFDENDFSSTENYINKTCNRIGSYLETVTSEKNSYAESDKKLTQAEKLNKEALQFLTENEFVLNPEHLDLISNSKSEWKSFFVDGVVKSGKELAKARKTKKVICTFQADGEATDDDFTLEFMSQVNSLKLTQDIESYKPEDYKASENGIVFGLQKNTDEDTSLLSLVCLNLEPGKLRKDVLKKTFANIILVNEESEKVKEKDKKNNSENDKAKNKSKDLVEPAKAISSQASKLLKTNSPEEAISALDVPTPARVVPILKQAQSEKVTEIERPQSEAEKAEELPLQEIIDHNKEAAAAAQAQTEEIKQERTKEEKFAIDVLNFRIQKLEEQSKAAAAQKEKVEKEVKANLADLEKEE